MPCILEDSYSYPTKAKTQLEFLSFMEVNPW